MKSEAFGLASFHFSPFKTYGNILQTSEQLALLKSGGKKSPDAPNTAEEIHPAAQIYADFQKVWQWWAWRVSLMKLYL